MSHTPVRGPTAGPAAIDGPGAGPRRAVGPLLGILCATTFLVTSAGTTLAPFLLEISRDLQVDLAAAANLVAVMSVSWGVASLLAGTASDRLGRRPILVFGTLALGGAVIGLSRGTSYPLAVTCQMLAGVGGGSYMGTVFAAVSDHVEPNQRGRALGWIVTGQSLSLVLGVPLVTFIGSLGGWRGALVAQGLATALAAVAVWLVVPGMERVREKRGRGPSIRTVLDFHALSLLGAGTMERTCFGGLAVYLATYLITSYDVPLRELAIGLALVALGNLVGNTLGSQLADRLPARLMLFAGASIVTGLLALPLLLWQPGLGVSLGLGFAYALTNALGRPALLATLSAVPSEVRGMVLGLNITCASLGWLGAAAIGGRLIAERGFGALGLLCAATGLLGAVLAILAWLSERTRLERPLPSGGRGHRS